MLAQTLEIKVALLGNVSAGKTTVLNALFRDKFGEVAMKRTTVGANFFRAHLKEPEIFSEKLSEDTEEDTTSSTSSANTLNGRDWLKVADNATSAETILKEISADNVRLREIESDTVHEKVFDVELSEAIFPMAQKTKLVVIDIPGINEAGTECKYKDYASQNWHTFDCAILVMDGKHDIRTDDQMFLLKLVKENLLKRKIPIIVLCNKVDYESDEQDELIRIAQKEVNKVFEISPDDDVTKMIVNKGNPDRNFDVVNALPPAFIPISALQAYIYRTASLMTFERFKSFDMSFIEEFGRELVGRVKWRSLTQEEKIKQVFEIVKDPEHRKRGLDECNFTVFLKVLSFFLGGEEIQNEIVKQQINVALDILKSDDVQIGMTHYVKEAYEKLRLLEGSDTISSPEDLQIAFWIAFDCLENDFFYQFDKEWKSQNVAILAPLVDELISYHKLCTEAGWLDEKITTVETMKAMIRRLIGVVLEKERKDIDACVKCTWYEKSDTFSPYDWGIIKGSILLLSHNKYFIENFGHEKMMIEAQGSAWNVPSSIDLYHHCRFCGSEVGNVSSTVKSCNSCHANFCTVKSCELCPECKTGFSEDGKCTYCGFWPEYFAWECSQIYDRATKTFVPVNEEDYKKYVHVNKVLSLSDTNHFGHIIWKFCQFMEANE